MSQSGTRRIRPVLVYPRAGMAAFIAWVKVGEFDDLR
jgi:hypothetical protein